MTDESNTSAKGLEVNVGSVERIISIAGGGLLALLGIRKRTAGGWLLAALGTGLIARGATGHCAAYRAMGVSTTTHGADSPGITIRTAVTINRSRPEVYAFWRDVEHLPQFMEHLESVRHIDERYSYWAAKVPGGMGVVEWTAEVVEDEPGERIVWRSTPDADVFNEGTVLFTDAPGGRGTEVHVTIIYRPPAGSAGRAAAALVNPALEAMVRQDVWRLKRLLEGGEVPKDVDHPSERDTNPA